MYTIVTGLKSDWLQYANHNTIYQELSLAPDKKTIIPTIESFLNEKWFKSWDDLAGHAQTKYWLPRPDSFLASKLLKMARKHLGYNIQFFSGHGWWRKHLMTAKLSKSDKCRLCLGKGPKKKKINFMVFDHNWGGGVSPNHTLIAKLHCFFKHYIHLQLYSICSCT